MATNSSLKNQLAENSQKQVNPSKIGSESINEYADDAKKI